MRIDINEKYCITSDATQFYVSQKSTVGKGEKAGEERLDHIGYLSTLKQCYTFLLQRQIRESSASGFKELMEEVQRIEKELKDSIRI